VFSTGSELGLQVAWALGLVSLAVAAALALLVLAMRLGAQRRTRRSAVLAAAWQPLMVRAALGEALPEPLPPLRRRERGEVMLMWIRMQDALRGSAHASLTQFGERIGLRGDALRWAGPGRRDVAQRVLGLMAMGHLGRAEDAAPLRAALDAPQPLVGLSGARALLQIDAPAFAPLVLDKFMQRQDWPTPQVGTLLREAGADAVAEPLVARLLAGTPAQQQRLLPLLRFAESPHGSSAVHRLVEQSSDPQVLSMALRQLHGPQSLLRARTLAEHPDALVRSAAAQAIGQIGVQEDRALLLRLMSDRDWWVRHRAAQAQLTLPGTDAGMIVALRRRLGDRFARDALDHVCAELALRGAPAAVP
jgi:HEAT repeat protein